MSVCDLKVNSALSSIAPCKKGVFVSLFNLACLVTLQVTKPYHALFNDQSLAAMKKMAEKFEEEEAQRKLAELETPVVKDLGVDNSDMDDFLDEDADKEIEEVVENHGDVDEDVDEM